MALEFQLVEAVDDADHLFRCYELPQADWLDELAVEYVKLRTEANFPVSEIRVDGIEVLDAAGVQARIQRATTPRRTGGNFDVLRSDLGEVLAYLILEHLYETSIGYKSVRDRELIQLPGRGIDAVGIESRGHQLALCLAEAKVSEESASPPAVVDSAPDSLRNQHLGHLGDSEVTSRKLWDVARRCRDAEQQRLFMTAALLFEYNRFDLLSIISCCVLTRPQSRYQITDFGSFRASPEAYVPAHIRFLVVRIPEAVEGTIDAFVEAIARVEAA